MSDNNKGNKDELTGPYSTLSVVERTKVLGLVPGTSPVEKRKPPLPSSPKPSISPRGSYLAQDRNASKANGTKNKVPPPVVPYRESKKRSQSSSHSTSSPVHSPNSVQCPLSPDAFKAKSPPPVPYTSVSPPAPVVASSYEEPVLRNVNEPPPQPQPVEPSASSIYSEVDTDVVVSIVGLKQSDEYSTAKCGRNDPSVAPPPPASGNTYESLSRDEKVEKVGQIPVRYEGVGLQGNDAATVTTSNNNTTSSANAKVDAKDKKPPIPRMKPPIPATKPVQFEQIPPKPKRTYAASKQQSESQSVNTSSNPVGPDHRLSKPMPLPRAKSEEEKEPTVDNNKGVKATGPERSLSQDATSGKETDKAPPNPAPYCYVDIDIPDSPSQIVPTEQLPSATTVNTSESSNSHNVAPIVKKVAPQSPKVDNKPRRRPPPPPPPSGAKPKPKPVQSANQPDSKHVRPPVAPNKPKLPHGHPNTLPDPTPAKPIPPKKWFHLVTKKPGSHSPVNGKKPLSPAVAKDAGNTPPSSKRRDSKRKKFFQRNRHSLEDNSAADSAVDKNSTPARAAATTEDVPDSPPGFGYATVGPNSGNEKNTTAANFKGGGDMTPHSKQRVLAAYAEVDINQKIKRSTERPLTNSHSEECLDKLLPDLSTEIDESDGDKFVISPYGTLPRQRHKGSNSKSALPIYSEVQKPDQKMDKPQAVLDSYKQAQQMRIYAEVEEPLATSSSERDQKTKQSQQATDTALMSSNSLKGDHPPPVPPQTTDSLRLDSPVPQVPPQTADSLKLDSDSPAPQVPPQTANSLKLDSGSPAPQVPPQTADSLRLDSSSPVTNEYEMPTIAAYATVEAKDVVLTSKDITRLRSKDVVTRKPSKEEIAAKTKSLGRSLKPKNKPAPLPPHPTSAPQPVPRSKKRLSRTHSAEASPGNSNAAKTEHKDPPKKEPLYESVDDLDLNIKPKSPIKPKSSVKAKSPPKVVSDSPRQTEFLFKNMEFKSVGKPSTSSTASYGNDDDSGDSTDWDTGDEDEEEEEVEEGQEEQVNQQRGKVYHIAKELLTTERTFVKGLTLLDKDFRQAVQSANRAHDRPILSEETLNAILSNVGSLCILNSGLLSELEDRLNKWDSNPKIGDVLMNTAPFFKLYTEYISNFDKALKLLEDSCRKNRAFGELVREFEGQPICANLPLSGYLLETVQRIPRYKLLLQDYLKHLPEDSDDRQNSERSLELISKVAAHVNESIRQVDNFKKLLDVQKKLVGDIGDSLISPSRKLLREGELLKYSRKEIQPRMFFLFTDILIYASAVPPANTTYKVIKRIPLHGMKVRELDDPEVKHGLEIISTCKSFRLGTNTLEEKVQWMKALQDALFEHEAMLQSRERYRAMSIDPGQMLNNLTESLGILAPPWLPDNCVSMCMMCSVRFNLTRRRHHCRACGNIFCAPCSSYLAALKYQDNKMDRVCQTCFEKLTGKGNENSSGEFVSGKKLRLSPKVKVAKARSAVLEVKARERNCEISGYLQMKDKKWRKQWLEVAEFALYVFEKHEDVSAKRSISLPGYLVIYPLPDTNDKTQLCITHPGTGSIFFKTESEEVATKWVEVFQNAVKLKSFSGND